MKMPASFEGLHEPVLEVLRNNEWAFRAGVVNDGEKTCPFDAIYIGGQLGGEFAPGAIACVLGHLAREPLNHIVLRFKTKENPDVIHIDTVVMEFLNKHRFELIMEHAEREIVTDKGPVIVGSAFDTSFIAWKLGLNLNPVTCALRRLAANPKNYIGLINVDPNNPSLRRDYGVSCDTKYAAAVAE